ncbi:hypothetical protein T4B_12248 [Trichinella pseudospiralis]|uniref:G-protein coupled receptors family 1 profile domain-containing protein n=1 Tax=Trichinella pseudospiralis TaxID=6337 RepID=A0A0V1IPX7_TRIPS|nr:hypothetical protein T4A_2870 [Trichinella pseudospiralis]KRZ24874.1 hypothetical protein T4B_12248 [Trichinella pseudospiralis]KRZ41281.1 hypothetical protein T4C_3996 [Trichinella pseudospiralis]
MNTLTSVSVKTVNSTEAIESSEWMNFAIQGCFYSVFGFFGILFNILGLYTLISTSQLHSRRYFAIWYGSINDAFTSCCFIYLGVWHLKLCVDCHLPEYMTCCANQALLQFVADNSLHLTSLTTIDRSLAICHSEIYKKFSDRFTQLLLLVILYSISVWQLMIIVRGQSTQAKSFISCDSAICTDRNQIDAVFFFFNVALCIIFVLTNIFTHRYMIRRLTRYMQGNFAHLSAIQTLAERRHLSVLLISSTVMLLSQLTGRGLVFLGFLLNDQHWLVASRIFFRLTTSIVTACQIFLYCGLCDPFRDAVVAVLRQKNNVVSPFISNSKLFKTVQK